MPPDRKQSQLAGKTDRSLPSETYNKGCNKIKSHPQDWGREMKYLCGKPTMLGNLDALAHLVLMKVT